ncbi:TPM domain-containing protein [Chryseobacterium chendengshani]|uniref:TPM domain-containing protein n=1 Tax=unclassified Chryseobacterium TaxID=2593645 RepID=UPI001C63E448|nr:MULTISPECIES: TPM domain-containing protein [unclassified Chryseobacterium]MBW7676089.1 TPM domain-containing protein [Chryseobacterium sp. LJ756]MBW8524307.1 TPM domain-containing protein [Chryseobacterium sp. LJ668]QYK17233.1 TPM domain-containing protein [Chryseobacterium sp. LJ668]
MRLRSLKILLSFLSICLYAFVSAQYAIPAKPSVLYPVYDEANLLTQQEKTELNNKLIKFADSTSTEIEVIIIPSTKGEDINYLATMFGEKWGIGQKDIDNGVVFLIATEDRTMSIQQGRAVEQYLTASVSGQILDYIVTPNFKQGKWYEGINGGTTAIMEAVQGKFKPLANQKKSGDTSTSKLLLIGFVIFIILIIFFRNKGGGDDGDILLGRRGRRNYPGGFFPFPGSFGGGGFGGGSSGGGGGFGGFGGGGSFGGGGASGGW